jgi:acetoin utilization deacetylase AcuC-like enzyme
MQCLHCDRYTVPLPAGHRWPAPKSRLLRERVARAQPGIRLVEAVVATDGELALAHEPDWIAAVREGTLTAAQQRELGLPWSPQLAGRSRCSVGATIGAARAALAEGVAAQLAGGSHHAHADKGSGWCVFNDVAVAARLMQAESHRTRRALLRVAIIDLDVHQGDGTAAIFRDDPTVFTLSMHAKRNFPARKQPGDLDVELPDGCADAAYLAALDTALEAMWARHAAQPPGLVLYVSGADAHEHDRLGRLALTTEGLAQRDRRVFEACRARGIPVAATMAGGYGRDAAVTVQIHLNTLLEAFDSWLRQPGRQARTMEQSPA